MKSAATWIELKSKTAAFELLMKYKKSQMKPGWGNLSTFCQEADKHLKDRA